MGRNVALFTVDDLCAWTGAAPDMAPNAESGARAVEISSVVVDSRACSPGSLFVALPGERTDGHRFVADACRNGAVAALVDRSASIDPKHAPELVLLRTENTLAALQAAARSYLERFPDVIRIGITGSNGKTTTKEMLFAVLREEVRAYASPGNLNSDCGLPLAVFRMPVDTEIAVFEMGMNRAGEIGELAEICRPDIAVITNIGTAHVGVLGSVDRIAEEKKAIASRFTGHEVLFVPGDDAYADYLSEGIAGEVVTFGYETQGAMYREHEGLAEVRLPDMDVRLPLPGRYNGVNALAAVAVARRLNIAPAVVARGLSRVTLPAGRSELIEGDRIVLNDSYNANPQSMVAGLDAFAEVVRRRGIDETIIVLGEMGELGEYAAGAHRDVVDYALQFRPMLLVLVGPGLEATARAVGGDGSVLFAATADEARAILVDRLRPGQAVFVKGSRAVGLEALLDVATGAEIAGEVRHA